MSVLEIELKTGETVTQWTNDNTEIILDEIYKYIFKFSKQKRKRKVVLRLKSGSNSLITRSNTEVFTAEVAILRDQLITTIDAMIAYYTKIEHYDRCATLLELKNNLLNEEQR